MYTRAKEIGGKVMAGGENNMLQPAASRCGQVRAKTKQALMTDWALTDGVTKKVAAGMGCHLRYMYSVDVCLQIGQLDYLVYSGRDAVEVLATSLGVVGLTTATTLDEAGCFAYHLAGVEVMAAHHVVAQHDREHRLLVGGRADDAELIFGQSLADLEHQILGCRWLEGDDRLDDVDAIDHVGLLYQSLGHALYCLGTEQILVADCGLTLLNELHTYGSVRNLRDRRSEIRNLSTLFSPFCIDLFIIMSNFVLT